MLLVFRYMIWALARLLVALRYRVSVKGLDKVRAGRGPILLMPNHPGYIDPLIVLTTLWPALKPRPLLYEGNFKNPLLSPIMILLDAIRVPDLDQASQEARQRTQEAIGNIINGLKAGDNVILWPSGRLQRTGNEHLGAARTPADVLLAVPEARMVLVRDRGVWGSMFSCAATGKRPEMVSQYVRGALLLLANLIVLAPRRRVALTVEEIDRSRLPELKRETLNPFLEALYNEGGPEQPTYVPHHFLFGPRTYEFPPSAEDEGVSPDQLKPETRDAVLAMVAEKLNRPLTPAETAAETQLEQLGMDSLDRMELGLQVERRFGFVGDQVPGSIGQLYALASGQLKRQPPKPPPPAWFRQRPDGPVEILADTVPEAFVERALADRDQVVTGDNRSGILTFERLLTGALLMARRFAELPGDNVGLLLPSSVACDMTLLGLFLAGKLPVLLNWTTGPANLAHAAQTMGLKRVVTSKEFIDRIGVKVEGTENVYLEELRKGIGKVESLRTLLTVRWFPGRVRARCPRPSPDAPAVVLFTSGSEKAPKAVPLTHRNILTNQREGSGILHVTRKDAILGFLPAFHSFGMSITGLFPLLTGLRVIRHPDPTDAAILARLAGDYKPTILVGTPTFASYILERAEPGQLTSLRLVVLGAEKCPQSVFDRFAEAAPGAVVVEGYGITECSPVVSVNPPDANRPGTVGKPIPGVSVLVVDLTTDAVVPQGERGMLLVGGPTVFPGYLGYEGESPFRERQGKRWYVTGDLVSLDADGYINFSGRLKRFLKAGGEMISLPALEEPFARVYPPTRDGPRVAVEGVELDGSGRRVVLFTTEEISLQQANALLHREGFHGVMRLDEVRRVDVLPVLGTGKTDYKVLRAQINADAPEPAGALR
jgi:acyl-CoA synthetase (AMP-forming)/AMP-acid ligase II/1-acyl-sn-glycerol-3-phosphate acyltransferase/acyl carrier protein